jgi:hypothetical protein
MNTTYFKGDLAEYTGKKEYLHGAYFYEIKILEGHMKGQLKLIIKEPKDK